MHIKNSPVHEASANAESQEKVRSYWIYCREAYLAFGRDYFHDSNL